MDMISAYQGDELLTTINEAGLDPFFVSMVLERESWEGVDAFRWNHYSPPSISFAIHHVSIIG
jgi:hypothetical protein